jgi:hypothetical protein
LHQQRAVFFGWWFFKKVIKTDQVEASCQRKAGRTTDSPTTLSLEASSQKPKENVP